MSRWIWIGLLALNAAACGDSESPESGGAESAQTATESEAEQVSEAATEAAENLAEPTPLDGPQDLAGLTAEAHDDGTITLEGTDRWGGRIETTYADVTYLRNALPVLGRSIDGEQKAALEAFVAQIGGEADEEPTPPEEAANEAGGGDESE